MSETEETAPASRPKPARAPDRTPERTEDKRAGVRAANGPPAPPEELPRERPAREELEALRRSQREDVMNGAHQYKMIVTVPLDTENYQYYWEVDEPGVLAWRLSHQRPHGYWERVEGQEPYHDHTDGLRPVHHVLLQKRRDWYDEDQQPRHERDRALMDQIKSGRPIEDFGKHPDGRPAYYTKDSRGNAVEVSIQRGGTPH